MHVHLFKPIDFYVVHQGNQNLLQFCYLEWIQSEIQNMTKNLTLLKMYEKAASGGTKGAELGNSGSE